MYMYNYFFLVLLRHISICMYEELKHCDEPFAKKKKIHSRIYTAIIYQLLIDEISLNINIIMLVNNK